MEHKKFPFSPCFLPAELRKQDSAPTRFGASPPLLAQLTLGSGGHTAGTLQDHTRIASVVPARLQRETERHLLLRVLGRA